jgi:hypothetical protein
MIVTGLKGGIGNQMFQYAAGRALSLRLGSELKLDLTWFRDMTGCTPRSYDLGAFRLTASPAEPRELARFEKKKDLSILGGVKILFGVRGQRVVEPDFRYWPGFESLNGDIHLVGYWQSEKYFKHIRSTLLKDFSIAREPAGKDKEIAGQIMATAAVSLHVRRGDYVDSAETSRFHGTCGLAYYEKAIDYTAARVASPHLFVFSDDPEWARRNIAAPCPVSVVDHNDASTSNEDLRLMSLCRHHIIANSSFGWWAAWLCQNPDKIVVTPARWFANEEKNDQTDDLIPEGWVRL